MGGRLLTGQMLDNLLGQCLIMVYKPVSVFLSYGMRKHPVTRQDCLICHLSSFCIHSLFSLPFFVGWRPHLSVLSTLLTCDKCLCGNSGTAGFIAWLAELLLFPPAPDWRILTFFHSQACYMGSWSSAHALLLLPSGCFFPAAHRGGNYLKLTSLCIVAVSMG